MLKTYLISFRVWVLMVCTDIPPARVLPLCLRRQTVHVTGLMATAFPDRSHQSSRRPESTSPACHPRNQAACIGNYCDAVLSGHFRFLLEVIAALHRGLCPAANHPNRTGSRNRRSRLVRERRWLGEIVSERWKPHSIGPDWRRINRLR